MDILRILGPAILLLAGSVPAWQALAQTAAGESGVRETLAEFKKGIDSGDTELGARLATGPFAPQFVALYRSLAEVYRKYNAPLPMEVGHVRILGDGRAKAETYLNPGRDLFVFTLGRDGGMWKFAHHEGILFPLFEYPKVPYAQVLALPQERRGFMTAEKEMAFMSRVYRMIEKQHGPAAARDFFLDGPGFRVAMDAWLPFLEGAGQFAVFLAILESNFYGTNSVVTKASAEEAEVQFRPLRALEVARIAVFEPKLSVKEFETLYVQLMKNRAESCGVDVEVSIQDADCSVKVRKRASAVRR